MTALDDFRSPTCSESDFESLMRRRVPDSPDVRRGFEDISSLVTAERLAIQHKRTMDDPPQPLSAQTWRDLLGVLSAAIVGSHGHSNRAGIAVRRALEAGTVAEAVFLLRGLVDPDFAGGFAEVRRFARGDGSLPDKVIDWKSFLEGGPA